ncbi:hypothetical protein H4219_005888 [Mycoemilia scoparia]|uniref:Uncharacterized protein n=1 Tax=Mycoemilia scoparia TaxID=417184 RepID=A0A9W8DP54_9FUNG|nr:hypothetical protein H4219_005888 [Mycoemilia scoparia]
MSEEVYTFFSNPEDYFITTECTCPEDSDIDSSDDENTPTTPCPTCAGASSILNEELVIGIEDTARINGVVDDISPQYHVVGYDEDEDEDYEYRVYIKYEVDKYIKIIEDPYTQYFAEDLIDVINYHRERDGKDLVSLSCVQFTSVKEYPEGMVHYYSPEQYTRMITDSIQDDRVFIYKTLKLVYKNCNFADIIHLVIEKVDIVESDDYSTSNASDDDNN